MIFDDGALWPEKESASTLKTGTPMPLNEPRLDTDPLMEAAHPRGMHFKSL
jgi:hypothetical protein